MKRNNKKGFTLIELLAVIVILAILATAAFTLILPKINEGRKKSFISEVAEVVHGAELYCTEHDCNDTSIDIYDVLLANNYIQKQGADKAKWGGKVFIDKNTDSAGLVTYSFKVAFRNENYKTYDKDATSKKYCVEYKALTIDKVVEVNNDEDNAANFEC